MIFPQFPAVFLALSAAVGVLAQTNSPPIPLDPRTQAVGGGPNGKLVCEKTECSAKSVKILIESLEDQFEILGPEIEPRTRCYQTEPLEADEETKCSTIPLTKEDRDRGSAAVSICGKKYTVVLCTGLEVVAKRVLEECDGKCGRWEFPNSDDGTPTPEIRVTAHKDD